MKSYFTNLYPRDNRIGLSIACHFTFFRRQNTPLLENIVRKKPPIACQRSDLMPESVNPGF